MGANKRHEEGRDRFVIAAGIMRMGVGLNVVADAGEGVIERIVLKVEGSDGQMCAVGPALVGPGTVFEAGDEIENLRFCAEGKVELWRARRTHGKWSST